MNLEETLVQNFDIQPLNDIVKINVGGKIFTTSRKTLVKEDSIFRLLFSGCFDTNKLENDGIIFLDRPPDIFYLILLALQTNKEIKTKDKVLLEQIKSELEYYGLNKAINLKFECNDSVNHIKKINQKVPKVKPVFVPKVKTAFKKPMITARWPNDNIYIFINSDFIKHMHYYAGYRENFCLGMAISNLFLFGLLFIMLFSIFNTDVYYYQFLFIPLYGISLSSIIYFFYHFLTDYAYYSYHYSLRYGNLITFITSIISFIYIFCFHYNFNNDYIYNTKMYQWWIIIYGFTLVNSGAFGMSIVNLCECIYVNRYNLMKLLDPWTIVICLGPTYNFIVIIDIIFFFDSTLDPRAASLALLIEVPFSYLLYLKVYDPDFYLLIFGFLTQFHLITVIKILFHINDQLILFFYGLLGLYPIYSSLKLYKILFL